MLQIERIRTLVGFCIGWMWLESCIPVVEAFTGTSTTCHNGIFPHFQSLNGCADAPLQPDPIESNGRLDLDPLVHRLLLTSSSAIHPDGEGGKNDSLSRLNFMTLRNASQGLTVWRSCLLQGRLPTSGDFTNSIIWPPEPLWELLAEQMTELSFPRLVLKHPEIVNAVLISLLKMVGTFQTRAAYLEEDLEEDYTLNEEEDDEERDHSWMYNEYSSFQNEDSLASSLPVIHWEIQLQERLQQLAVDVVNEGFTNSWGGVMNGVQALDQLFGPDHGLLQVPPSGIASYGENEEISSTGFGLEDGIWKHSGWKLLPALQREMATMPELKQLMTTLGRRPTAEDSDSIRKFVPRRFDPEASLGAEYDPTQRASVQGITLSGSLSEMLPSEAMLLVISSQDKQDYRRGGSLSSPFRRLFLAKMVESKLWSYEASGWQDIPSSRIPFPRILKRSPSAPGGPIIICLDTSWSMTGRREQLSKAFVIACVAAAHQQKRDIQLVAFSSASNVIETGPLSANTQGIRRLLDFLSSSFGGGTDITGALKHAMETVARHSFSSVEEDARDGHKNNDAELNSRNSEESSNRQRQKTPTDMAAADILLVTDGEIPDPPVSDAVMDALDRLKYHADVQVHGLLVGKRESAPLSNVCTHVYDFLIDYERILPTTVRQKGFARGTGMGQLSTFSRSRNTKLLSMAVHRSKRWGWAYASRRLRPSRLSVLLRAKRSGYDDRDDDFSGRGGRRRRSGEEKGRRKIYDDNDDKNGDSEYEQKDVSLATIHGISGIETGYALQALRALAINSVMSQKWKASARNNVLESEALHVVELHQAIEKISFGLVERDEEARLVVLGVVAQEHILFLGPPGTAKSIIGKRLSQLCGGAFFQRLFTRFTTPEEIFGPLSLKALENDEYRRKIEGFLPTATVAFLDEIFKANSAILNTLLTVLNERQYDNGAGVREQCPIRCVVGASNEFPETDELDALYDRFLIRKEVLPVSDDGIVQLLGMPLPADSCDHAEFAESCETVFVEDLDKLITGISLAADDVAMDEDICFMMKELRTFMREEMDVYVSDRRLVKAARLLKISAACHGRAKVDPIDCLLLQHIVWRMPEQRVAVREWLWNNLTPGSIGLTSSTTIQDESLKSAATSSVRSFRLLLDGMRKEAAEALRKTSGDVTGENGARQRDIVVIHTLKEEIKKIGDGLAQRLADLSRHAELLKRSEEYLWLDPSEAQAAAQLLLPRAEAYMEATERALKDARCLEFALMRDGGLTDENRLAVVQMIWDDDVDPGMSFSAEALAMGMKEAKAKFDIETFRNWKRARKKSGS